MSGLSIQAEVAAALAETGAEVGSGLLVCTIRREPTEVDEPQNPWDAPANPANEPALYRVTGIEEMQEIRDMPGNLIGVKKRKLLVGAITVEPLKSDTIAVGVDPDNVTVSTVFEAILGVDALSPAGTPLMYTLELKV